MQELIRAYDEARRRAQLEGRPASRQEVMAALYPVFASYRQRGQQDEMMKINRDKLAMNEAQFSKRLAAEQEMFNENLDFEKRTTRRAKPWQYANVAVSGLGNLALGLSTMKDEALRQQRIQQLLNRYK